MTRHYPDLGNASDWSWRAGNLLQPMKSTNQIWVVTRSFLRRRLAGNQWWRRQMLAVLSEYRLAAMKTNVAYRKINQSGLCFVILLGSLNNNGDANESVK